MRELIEKMNNTQQKQQVQQKQQHIPNNSYMLHNHYQPQFQPHYSPQFQPQYQPNYNNFNYHRGRGGHGRDRRGGRGYVSRERRYCWTHGLCSHNGRECSNPAQGHQVDATLENRMGGNMRNVNA